MDDRDFTKPKYNLQALFVRSENDSYDLLIQNGLGTDDAEILKIEIYPRAGVAGISNSQADAIARKHNENMFFVEKSFIFTPQGKFQAWSRTYVDLNETS